MKIVKRDFLFCFSDDEWQRTGEDTESLQSLLLTV